MDSEFWTNQLRNLFANRRVIVKHEVIAATTEIVRAVRSVGASDVLVVATSGIGAGEIPTDQEARTLSLDIPVEGLSTMEAIRAGNAAVAELPTWANNEIDRFDPAGTALVIGDFLNESAFLAGRPFLAYRRPEWIALDDKTTIDKLWDAIGLPRAASVVVPADADQVGAVFDRLDVGDGVVLALDSIDGWTGGAAGTRWAPTPETIIDALAGWANPGRQVRVMPFLEGVPCSIHGIVLPDYEIALRPVEMIVLRDSNHQFVYAGCASFYDPPDHIRTEMRALARTVGAALREQVGFRGAFTLDGIISIDGFRPTELNPRNGAGMNAMARALEEPFPLQLLLDAVVAGVEFDWRPPALEAFLLSNFDARRGGGTWRSGETKLESASGIRLANDANVLRAAAPDELHDVDVTIGPRGNGWFVRALFQPDRTPVGPSAAPLACAVWHHFNREFDLGLPDVHPARDLSQGSDNGIASVSGH